MTRRQRRWNSSEMMWNTQIIIKLPPVLLVAYCCLVVFIICVWNQWCPTYCMFLLFMTILIQIDRLDLVHCVSTWLYWSQIRVKLAWKCLSPPTENSEIKVQDCWVIMTFLNKSWPHPLTDNISLYSVPSLSVFTCKRTHACVCTHASVSETKRSSHFIDLLTAIPICQKV